MISKRYCLTPTVVDNHLLSVMSTSTNKCESLSTLDRMHFCHQRTRLLSNLCFLMFINIAFCQIRPSECIFVIFEVVVDITPMFFDFLKQNTQIKELPVPLLIVRLSCTTIQWTISFILQRHGAVHDDL